MDHAWVLAATLTFSPNCAWRGIGTAHFQAKATPLGRDSIMEHEVCTSQLAMGNGHTPPYRDEIGSCPLPPRPGTKWVWLMRSIVFETAPMIT